MFELLSSLLKYIFITIIYFFLFSIIRLIYLDIRSTNSKAAAALENAPYLKLINRNDALFFKVDESYILKGKKVLGRSKKSDIVIEDPFLSGEHVQFSEVDGNIIIKDIGSKNGTILNGQSLLQETTLKNGDKIDIGQMSFLFVNNTSYSDERINV